DAQESPADELAVDEDAHRPGPVRRDAYEGAGEVAKRLADDPARRRDPRRDVSVDADARGVHEDPAIHLAHVDGAAARAPEGADNVARAARVAERAREVVPRPDRVEREDRAASHDPVGDLVRRSVPARRDDEPVAVGRGLAGEPRGFLRRGRADDVDADALGPEVGGHPFREALT